MNTYLNIIDVMAIPGSVEELIPKAEDEDVLDHLLAEVVINAEDLVLLPVGLESLLEVSRALQILPERLLNLQTLALLDSTAGGDQR